MVARPRPSEKPGSLSRLDRKIVLGALLLFALSVGLIVDDRLLFRIVSSEQERQHPVARLSDAHRDVRRRLDSDVAWFPLPKSEEIYQGDSIFTAPNSDAEVSFKDQSKIDIGEGSLVVIEVGSDGKRPRVNLQQGTIKGVLGSGKKLELVTQGKTEEISGDHAVIQMKMDREGQAELSVVSGSAVIKTEKGKTELKENEALKIAQNGSVGQPVDHTPPPELVFPSKGQRLTYFKNEDAKLNVLKTKVQWKSEFAAKRYHVEISRDEFFQDPKAKVLERDVEHTEVGDPELPSLQDGTYFWRVRGVDPSRPNLASSKTSSFTVAGVEHASPLVTGFQSVRNVVLAGDSAKVPLEWASEKNANYEVEISKSPLFPKKSLEEVQKTDQSKLEWQTKKTGRFYWRVRARYADGTYSRPSGARSFRIFEPAPLLAQIPRPPKPEREPASIMNESVQNSEPDWQNRHDEKKGYVAFSTMLAPYAYTLVHPAGNVQGSAASNAVTGRISGEVWLKERFALGGSAELTSFQLSSQVYYRKSFDFTGKYRMELGNGARPWTLMPKLGFEAREYVAAYPNATFSQFMALGPQIGFDLRKSVTDRFSIGAKAAYFLPLSLVGAPGAMTPDWSYSNVGAGIQGLYWVDKAWGLGAGGFFELRSISFNYPGSTSPDLLSTNAAYFFGSVVYRFGG